MKIIAKVFFGLLGLSISIVASGGKYTDQAKAQLRMAKLVAATEGYEETHEDKFGSLDDDDSDSFSFNLSRPHRCIKTMPQRENFTPQRPGYLKVRYKPTLLNEFQIAPAVGSGNTTPTGV